MEGSDRYDTSLSGEFTDKVLEKEFFNYYMKYYSKFIGPVALIFGVIFMLFIIGDYSAKDSISSFTPILAVRVLFLFVSSAIFLALRKINDYSKLSYIITSYEVWAIISFMVIIYQYESIGIISFLSAIAITLALYIIPNRLIYVQVISVIFNLSFCLLFTLRADVPEKGIIWEIAAYSMIFIVFGNIEAYFTNYYRRKHFADSRELLRLSVTDSLTGIYNRTRFNQELDRWVDYCRVYGNPLSLVIFDIDDFKSVNDSYGHFAGDVVLQDITSIVKKTIRRTDIFARWGGEEFIILLPNTDISQSIDMTERMRDCIQKNKYAEDENITCSFGLVSLQKSEDANSLMQRADNLLYQAKKRGKNTVVHEGSETMEQA